MKHYRVQLAVFLAAFLATLTMLAPASLMSGWVARATGGRLELANASGTVWHGTATPVVQFQHEAPLRLERMAWSVSLRRLWRGELLLDLSLTSAPKTPQMEVALSPRQVELDHLALDLPAAAMGGLDPVLQAMGFQGRLAISARRLVVARNGTVSGSATANWQQAGSTLSPVNPFGNYRLDLTGAGDKVNIALATVSGDLKLQGQGAWQRGALSFQASASAGGARKEAFSEMLHHLGPETSPGVFSFKLGQ